MSFPSNIKLLFISSDKFPTFRVDVTVLFGKELGSRGYKIDWLMQSLLDCTTSYQTDWKGGRAWVGATDNGPNRLSRLKKHILNLSNQLKVTYLARKNNYDIIQVKDEFISALASITAAKKNKAKFIYWLSYPFPEASIHRAKDGTARYPVFYFIRGHIFKFLLYRIILPAADHIFVQSEQMKKDVAAEGIPETRLTAVPMGVEIDKIPFNEDAAFLSPVVKEKKVLYLGTLAKVRKMDFLIRVFAQVLKQEPDAILYLVGAGDDPTDEQILVDEAKKLGISSSIIMTGFLPMEEAWQYVRQADVCVSPFYPTFILNSTSPTKLIEYMAMGKAVVANDHPEQRLVIGESSAGLCVRYDEEAFSTAIVYLLKNPQKTREMGIRGRRYVEQHRSYKAIADIVDQKYQQVIKSI
jgi:glycosyltransferase involved in cell wall biosynthesis